MNIKKRHFEWIITLLLSFASVATAATVTHTFQFETPSLQTLPDGTQLFEFAQSAQYGKVGEPTLPFQKVALQLPAGEQATAIRITYSERVELSRPVVLAPRQAVRRFSSAGMPQQRLMNDQVYAQMSVLAVPDLLVRTHYLHGRPIALARFTPVEYVPGEKQLAYYRHAEVTIDTEPSLAAETARQNWLDAPWVLQKLKAVVDNPQTNPAVSLRSSNSIDYLIITTAEFKDAYEELADFHRRRGLATRIVTVESIYLDATGFDQQDIIRNYIRNYYQQHGIRYLLLAGDADEVYSGGEMQIPDRKLYAEAYSDRLYQEYIPSDLYYAALDGNWNADGDSRFGEPEEADLLPELAVGRITADNLTEIQNVIHKIIQNQNMPVVADARKVLLAGELLYSDPLSYGADFLELLIDTHSDSGYTTQGMPADLDFTRLYDKNQTWSGSDLIAEINNGCNWLFHNGHASSQSVMHLYSSSLRETTFAGADGVNHPFPLVYSVGCLAARFDSDDSIGELFVTLPNFAVAFIGNTRYGWFNEGQSDGPSTHLNREFLNAIYGHGATSLSAAHAQSQIATAPFVDLPGEWEPGATRWTFYACNVLGDPALELWTNTTAYFLTVDYPETISLETRQLTIGTGVSDARVVLSAGNNLVFQAVTDGSGQATIALEPDSTVTEWTLTILKQNYVPFVRVISVNDFGTGTQDDIISDVDDFSLSPAWPNPFNATTTFRYSLKSSGMVTARIVNLQGQVITELLHQNMPGGRHKLQWQAVDVMGNELPSGIYFLELASPDGRLVRPCMLLK